MNTTTLVPMQPIFAIGCPRSGTTLLLHFLMSSGKFPTYTFDETHFFSHYYRRYGDINLEKNFNKFKNDVLKTDWFNMSGLKSNDIQSIPSQRMSYSYIFELAMQKIAVDQDFTIWLEKTPWHMLYTKEIKATIPNSKFLLMVRDPRDVVLSIKQYGWAQGIFQGAIRAAISWRWHMRKAVKDLGKWPEDTLLVQYENLVNEPTNTARNISTFLDITLDIDTIQNNSRGVLNSSNSSFSDENSKNTNPVYRWKNSPDKKLIQQITYILRNDLAQYGYEKIELTQVSLFDKLILNAMSISFGFLKRFRQILFPIVRK